MEKRYITEEEGVVKVRTCAWSPPGDHPVACSMFLHVKDGKVVKVEGDPDHPITNGRLCPRCLALPEALYHKDRILHPMIRDRKDRGKNAWKQVTWEEALDLIEEKVNYIKENYGAEACFTIQGTGREVILYAPAYASAVLGTPIFTTALSGDSCYGPRCAVGDYQFGAGYPELDYAAFFPDRYDNPQYEVPKYILIWGKNPIYSSGDGFFGHAIIDLMKRGSKLIVVDPRVIWLATRADYHLQLRPSTDAAVALGLLNVVISEDLYDHDFVENWCFGFKDLAKRAAEYPPERVEEISWVPKETLIAAARAFATNAPSSVAWGLALDMQANGIQAGYAIMSLAAICGYIDVPGGITLTMPASFMGKWRYDTFGFLPDELKGKYIDDPSYGAHNAGSPQGHQSHPDLIVEMLETEKPWKLRMLWILGANFLSAQGAMPRRFYEAYSKLDFVVTQDVFMNPTAMALADVMLPLTMVGEHEGIALPHFGRNTHLLGAINKAVDEGDCKSDVEIMILAGKRLNPDLWPWDTPAEFFTSQIQTKYDWTFEDLQNDVIYQQEYVYKKYEKGLMRPDGKLGFNTPTGKVELKSTIYPGWGEDALPYFEEPLYGPNSSPMVMEEFPLILTTGGRNITFFHSEHRQIPSMREINPWPKVTIHPKTAAKYGIQNGDWVCIENPMGSFIQKAKVAKEVDPRVVHAEHGWWFPEQDAEVPNLFGAFKSNPNLCVPQKKIGKLGYGAPYKGIVCKIYKVDGLDG
ncbi:MAG: molybdopterin-dependent oxidoreductase [Coriobacteriia bacterium]|nr:molybdopterin-dependent oxidoreductase [Coriobacteriia bacterium]